MKKLIFEKNELRGTAFVEIAYDAIDLDAVRDARIIVVIIIIIITRLLVSGRSPECSDSFLRSYGPVIV